MGILPAEPGCSQSACCYRNIIAITGLLTVAVLAIAIFRYHLLQSTVTSALPALDGSEGVATTAGSNPVTEAPVRATPGAIAPDDATVPNPGESAESGHVTRLICRILQEDVPLNGALVGIDKIYDDYAGPPRTGGTTLTDPQGLACIEINCVAPPLWKRFRVGVTVVHPGSMLQTIETTVEYGTENDIGDIVLERGGGIAGTVTYVSGQPARGIEIRVGPAVDGRPASMTWSDEAAPPEPRAQTDEQGAFSLLGIAPGWCVVWASPLDGAWLSTHERILVRPGQVTGGIAIEIDLRQLPTLSGVVLDPAGRGLANATVRASRSGLGQTNYHWSTRTNSAGQFAMVMRADLVDIEVDAGLTYQTERRVGVPLDGDSLRIDLKEAIVGVVQVLDYPSGGEVPEIEIFVLPATDLRSGGTMTYRNRIALLQYGPSDVRKFKVPDQDYVISCSALGRERAVSDVLPGGQAPGVVTVHMRERPKIAGVVVDDKGPVAGAVISIHKPSMSSDIEGMFDMSAGPPLRLMRSDERGVFAIPASYERALVVAQHAGTGAYGSTWITRSGNGDVTCKVVLRSGVGIVEGVVIGKDTDTYGRGAKIVGIAQGDGWVRTTRTARDGTFRFDGVPVGRWQCAVVDREWEPVATVHWPNVLSQGRPLAVLVPQGHSVRVTLVER